ncbi:MAG: hypothetical protein M1837_002043 [Sclerophora amabilis]|nr:MAG: hypothetical protein M1837_002043 [Sclerophora amabilis]
MHSSDERGLDILGQRGSAPSKSASPPQGTHGRGAISTTPSAHLVMFAMGGYGFSELVDQSGLGGGLDGLWGDGKSDTRGPLRTA